MGMAASQVRLLQLTTRKNDIGWQLENLSMQKTSLSRDMQRVTKNYQNALSTKKLKMSNNSGVTYMDLSYSNLMRPGNANQNKPYLITNNDGKVVIDSQYLKYAEMISADGKAGGDWTTNRTKILASLIDGLSAETIDNANATSAALDTANKKVNTLKESVDKAKNKAMQKSSTDEFVQLFGNTSLGRLGSDAGLGNSIYKWYNNNDASGNTKMCWSLSQDSETSKKMIKEFLDGIKANMGNYLDDTNLSKFSEALDTVYKSYGNFVDDAKQSNAGNVGNKVQVSLDTSGDAAGYYVLNPNLIIESILSAYRSAGGETQDSNNSLTYYTTYNRKSDAYNDYIKLQGELNTAISEQKAAVNTDNQALKAEQESKIKFYDQIFSAIAEKGWVQNDSVEDNDYLNQMLQNNMYYITTMSEDTDEKGKQYYIYDESIASNVDNIFSVNDSDYQNEALTEYEYEKSIISEKESRIDTRMKNLETEQSAINTMIKGIETVKNDNTERTMNIFA